MKLFSKSLFLHSNVHFVIMFYSKWDKIKKSSGKNVRKSSCIWTLKTVTGQVNVRKSSCIWTLKTVTGQVHISCDYDVKKKQTWTVKVYWYKFYKLI